MLVSKTIPVERGLGDSSAGGEVDLPAKPRREGCANGFIIHEISIQVFALTNTGAHRLSYGNTRSHVTGMIPEASG
jgi:hypothetical protein